MTQKHLHYLHHIPSFSKPHRTLSIGTDCSGMDTPIQALKLLGVSYVHQWSCDNDPFARETIQCNFQPKMIFDSIFERPHKKLPYIDIYVCGFPCQTFSTLGKQQGFHDTRGIVFFECVRVIKTKKPRVFILENVKGLLGHDKGNTFKVILQSLSELNTYHIHHQVVNTADYGIPQQRNRVYIVGIRKQYRKTPFSFPPPIHPSFRPTIDCFLEKNNTSSKLYELTDHKKQVLHDLIRHQKINSMNENWFVNLNVSSHLRAGAKRDVCPCLLAGEGGNCIFYLTSIRRRLSCREYLRLQGFPDTFQTTVSDRFVYKQCGNAMSVNVLCFLLRQILVSVSW